MSSKVHVTVREKRLGTGSACKTICEKDILDAEIVCIWDDMQEFQKMTLPPGLCRGCAKEVDSISARGRYYVYAKTDRVYQKKEGESGK